MNSIQIEANPVFLMYEKRGAIRHQKVFKPNFSKARQSIVNHSIRPKNINPFDARTKSLDRSPGKFGNSSSVLAPNSSYDPGSLLLLRRNKSRMLKSVAVGQSNFSKLISVFRSKGVLKEISKPTTQDQGMKDQLKTEASLSISLSVDAQQYKSLIRSSQKTLEDIWASHSSSEYSQMENRSSRHSDGNSCKRLVRLQGFKKNPKLPGSSTPLSKKLPKLDCRTIATLTNVQTQDIDLWTHVLDRRQAEFDLKTHLFTQPNASQIPHKATRCPRDDHSKMRGGTYQDYEGLSGGGGGSAISAFTASRAILRERHLESHDNQQSGNHPHNRGGLPSREKLQKDGVASNTELDEVSEVIGQFPPHSSGSSDHNPATDEQSEETKSVSGSISTKSRMKIVNGVVYESYKLPGSDKEHYGIKGFLSRGQQNSNIMKSVSSSHDHSDIVELDRIDADGMQKDLAEADRMALIDLQNHAKYKVIKKELKSPLKIDHISKTGIAASLNKQDIEMGAMPPLERKSSNDSRLSGSQKKMMRTIEESYSRISRYDEEVPAKVKVLQWVVQEEHRKRELQNHGEPQTVSAAVERCGTLAHYRTKFQEIKKNFQSINEQKAAQQAERMEIELDRERRMKNKPWKILIDSSLSRKKPSLVIKLRPPH
jgi:hypothetical protein